MSISKSKSQSRDSYHDRGRRHHEKHDKENAVRRQLFVRNIVAISTSFYII